MGICFGKEDMSTDLDKLHAICQKTYKEQAVWFLNCFWEEFADKEAELFWQYVLKNAELDLENHELGCGLDEMKAHVFLEKFDETLTVREMRSKLRSTGAIGESERPKLVPLTHYLLYKYNADWHTLCDETRQGDNKEEMEKAEQMLAEVQAAFKESERAAGVAKQKLQEAQKAEADAKARENEAVQRENEAKTREAEAVQRENEAKASEAKAKEREAAAKASAEQARQRETQANNDAQAAKQAELDAQAAQKELEAALAELKKEEDAFNAKKSELEKKGNDESIGLVTRNKAKNELAQLLSEDPLPLKRAKITQEAAVRKAEKATVHAAQTRQAAEASAAAASKARAQAEQDAAQAESARKSAEADAQAASQARAAASQAREAASQARQAAAQARQRSEDAKAAADAALDAAADRLSEAEAYLEEVKRKPGQSYGSLWWIDRELHEQKKYLPTSRGGIAKK